MNIIGKIAQLLDAPVQNMAAKHGQNAKGLESSKLWNVRSSSSGGPGPGADKVTFLPPPPPNALRSLPYPNSAQLRGIAVVTDFTIPKSDLDRIEVLQSRHDAAEAGVIAHTRDEADKAYVAQAQRIQEAVSTGKTEELSRMDAWSRDDWMEDYSFKRQAYSDAKQRISAEAFEVIQPHYSRFAKKALELADLMDETEQPVYAKLSIPWQPSFASLMVRKAAMVIAERETQFSPACGLSPKSLAEFMLA